MKFIVVLKRGKRKRARTIEADSERQAELIVSRLMLDKNWQESELYYNDSITPDMVDGYLLYSTGKVEDRGRIFPDLRVYWTKANLSIK